VRPDGVLWRPGAVVCACVANSLSTVTMLLQILPVAGAHRVGVATLRRHAIRHQKRRVRSGGPQDIPAGVSPSTVFPPQRFAQATKTWFSDAWARLTTRSAPNTARRRVNSGNSASKPFNSPTFHRSPPARRSPIAVGGAGISLGHPLQQASLQAGSAQGLIPRSAPIRWAQAKPLNATALSPCPGKQESPTQ
jgi:hypothetical protein